MTRDQSEQLRARLALIRALEESGDPALLRLYLEELGARARYDRRQMYLSLFVAFFSCLTLAALITQWVLS